MAVTTSSVAKITFVEAEITLEVAVITKSSSVAKVTFVVAEITFKALFQCSRSFLKNGSIEYKNNNNNLYLIKLTRERSPAGIH